MYQTDNRHTAGLLHSAAGLFARERRLNSSITGEIVMMNIRRLFYIAAIAVPVHLAHVALFMMKSASGSEAEMKWKAGIIGIHALQAAVMSVFAVLLFYLRKRELPAPWMRPIPYVFFALFLGLGLALVTIDQYVTTNITPFIVVCTIMGVILLMRPAMAAVFYPGAYILFYFSIGLLQTQPAILLTNRVNGITIVAIGICLSIIMWQNNRTNLLQNREIVRQRRDLEDNNRKLEMANRELENLSSMDELTRVYNRRYFNSSLSMELDRHRRGRLPLSLVMCDIDYFKNYNDALGHLAGDTCLQTIAREIRACLARPFDVLARYGGEEFAIILPQTDGTGALVVAEKVRDVLKRLSIPHPDSAVGPLVTLSFGITTIIPGSATSITDFIAQADRALYKSKAGGRDRVTA